MQHIQQLPPDVEFLLKSLIRKPSESSRFLRLCEHECPRTIPGSIHPSLQPVQLRHIFPRKKQSHHPVFLKKELHMKSNHHSEEVFRWKFAQWFLIDHRRGLQNERNRTLTAQVEPEILPGGHGHPIPPLTPSEVHGWHCGAAEWPFFLKGQHGM